jgi:hypothetical protein
VNSNLKIIPFGILAVAVITWMCSCGSKTVETTKEAEKISLTKDSLEDLSSLKKMIVSSIHPITFSCDTLILNNIPPIYCSQATMSEMVLGYRPFEEDSAEFLKAFNLTGKKIFFRSATENMDEEKAVMVDIEGRILSKDQMLLIENYNKYPSSGHIEKLFTFSKGKWNYFLKDSSWMSPVFDEGSNKPKFEIHH